MTAYHPQSDSQSERTNQNIEIALRHLVNIRKDDWTHCLGEIEFNINNNTHASTAKSPRQFLTGLNAPSALEAATSIHSSATEWSTIRDEIRDDARNALLFAQTKMSIYYDVKHKPMTFKVGDMVYVHLAGSMEPGYHLPYQPYHKLSQQWICPFKVLERVGKLAYKLDLPTTWKIQPVLSIAHLEPHVLDTFDRSSPAPLPEMIVGYDSEVDEEWEVDEIIRDRYNKRRKRKEYLLI